MTIEIHQPELEALIHERMEAGRFETVEQLLVNVLKVRAMSSQPEHRTGADLVAALMSCPHPDVDLEPKRYPSPVREPVSF
jgi:hypothetical protein